MSEQWFVQYKIPTMTGDKIHELGPYLQDEVQNEYDDIRTFDGITECEIVGRDIAKDAYDRAMTGI